MNARKTWHAFALATCLSGCATFREMTAPPSDFEDYRAFRVAAYEGTRLARAKTYLDRHPRGTFAPEVREAFEAEEPRYFAKAQESPEGARRYLVDLPHGPHAAAAFAMLIAHGSSMQDAELRDIARRVQYEDAKLEAAAVQRRAVGDTILGAVGVFLDDATYGVPRASGPAALRALLLGTAPGTAAANERPTWGDVPARRDEDLFFILPTRPERESRLLTLRTEVLEKDGVTVGGAIWGADMLIRWAEADRIIAFDPSLPDDRIEAQVHAMDRLSGALERRFPEKECPDQRRGAELYRRTCDGWEVVVVAGDRAGADDSITIRRDGRGKKTAP